MQNYKEIALTDIARDAVMQLQDNIKTVASGYAGAAFPTENLYDGMVCFRTDERSRYTYNGDTGSWDKDVEKADIPTAISAFTNDKNYTTKTTVQMMVNTVSAKIPTAVSALTNDSGYTTKTEVQEMIDSIVSADGKDY